MKYLVESPNKATVIANHEERSGKQPVCTTTTPAQSVILSPSEESPRTALPQTSPLKGGLEGGLGVFGVLDPASGSGHILVEAFDLLYQMYMEEYYMPDEAVESIFANNLFGLDIDLRAAQLARFALLMKAAAKHPGILKMNLLPKVFAMPAPEEFSRQDVLDFLGSEGLHLEEKLTAALELMQQAQNLGSVMQFDFTDEERTLVVARLDALKSKAYPDNLEVSLLNRIAPYIEVLAILTRRYEAIAANPPYMGQGNMNGDLKNYINTRYPLSKSDLFAVFIEVMIDHLKPDARMGCITMESWMFLSSYEKLRNYMLNNYSIVGLAHFGWHIIGIAFGTATLILEKSKKIEKGVYSYLTIDDVDRKENLPYVFPKKDNGRYATIPQSNFSKIPGSPIAYWVSDKVISLFKKHKISKYFIGKEGVGTRDDKRFLRIFFEVNKSKIGTVKWIKTDKAGGFRKWYGNLNYVINWENDGFEIKNFKDEKGKLKSRPQNIQYLFKEAISWGKVSAGIPSFRYRPEGLGFNDAAPSVFSEINKLVLLGFLNSKVAKYLIGISGDTINYTVGTIESLPCAQLENELIEKIVAESVKSSVIDWDSRETSWDFQTSPLFDALLGDIGMATSQFAYSRLQHAFSQGALLQQVFSEYVAQWSSMFYQLHANEEELNRIFIDIYGLNEELDPMVPLKDITILQDELDTKVLEKTDLALRRRRHWKLVEGKWELSEDESKALPALPIKRDVVMKQFISYAIGCMMGRYALEKPGLILANHGDTLDDYHRIIGGVIANHEERSGKQPVRTGTTSAQGVILSASEESPRTALPQSSPLKGGQEGGIIDDDAIIPLMGTACTFPDDAVNRFNHFLEVVWGAENLTQNKNFMQDCLDQEIEKYLVSSFWKDHCRTYKKKPIYWLFSSEKGAFQVLVYMHRMNRFTVEKIRSKYLLKHLQYLQQEIDRMAAGSSLNRDEQKSLDSLRAQYSECQRYDLLLKDCADRQIDFDLDDGITTNYELFKGVVAPIK